MTYNTASIEDILHNYERTRLHNKRLLQDRKEEIYNKIPRIAEIDEETPLSYLSYVKERILKGDQGDYSQVSSNNRSLDKEKRLLLREQGYDENYLDPIYTCPLCKDTGYIDGERCSCFVEKIIDLLYLQSNLKHILQKENFESFSMEYYSKEKPVDKPYSPYDNMSKIVSKSQKFINRFDEVSVDRGNILIYGETGLGKTFLTNCIAKELLDRKHSVLYLSSNQLFEDVLGNFYMKNKSELEDLYKYIYNCELLIIDDLGTEFLNDFVRSQLFEIINKRSTGGLSTLISTNLPISELGARYSDRIFSRIVADYTIFNIYGDNIRWKKRKNS